MSDVPVTDLKFLLELELALTPGDTPATDARGTVDRILQLPRRAAIVRAAVKDASAVPTAVEPASSISIAPGPPAQDLAIVFAVDSGGALKPGVTTLPPRLPFDPALAGDDGVLTIAWQLVHGRAEGPDRRLDPPERRLETQDNATLRLLLTNRSHYYVADDLKITIAVRRPDGGDPGPRPDGNELLSIWPDAQSVQCLLPGKTHAFDYLVATRGPQAGLYTVAVTVDYDLVYVYRELCRQTRAVAHVPLRLHGGNPMAGGLESLPHSLQPQLEHISPQRRLHMSEQDDQGHGKRRELHPIERKVLAPGGGELIVMYRLVKGSHTRPDDTRPSYGWNPGTKAAESYFSTDDEAAMEITIRNLSGLHLKHVHLADVQLFNLNKDDTRGSAVEDRLPDGNLLFEVLPNEVYFGGLLPGEQRTRYLGLVTRGIRPGTFVVHGDLHYEIVDGRVAVGLPIHVNPD